MRCGYANAIFGIVLVGIPIIVRIFFLLGMCCKRTTIARQTYLQESMVAIVIIEAIVIFIGWTTWFYWSQSLWSDLSSSTSCTEGRNLWDFINFILLLGLTVWPAILMTIMACIGLCCLPCIITAIRDYCAASREERAKQFSVLDGLVKTKYNPDDFKTHTECAICFCEFGEDDEVSPLPCNTNHYFHTECIQTWIKENPSCPMCRAEITPEALEAFSVEFDKRKNSDDSFTEEN